MINNNVKLVVWDLDDTFWSGTLAEGEIVPIDSNIDLVKTLTTRGIIQSICSKNDSDKAQARLASLGVSEYFVFPRISFSPKGEVVAQLIEDMALRPENVLFIDDNRSNLEEVKYYSPGIMIAHPADILDQLLEHPKLAGKPDPDMQRLKQYKLLERKADERKTTSLSNEEFLRSSQIKIAVEYDVEANFDRVVELINRSNQLNYTKIRIETAEETEKFRASLSKFGYHAGCIRASDRYGDYGLVGFFLLTKRAKFKKLIHFVFSCRTMHMGIEQYIYEMLGRPEIDIVKPVSYGLKVHGKVDWIQEAEISSMSEIRPGGGKLVLVGGCEMLQLATYCGSGDRHEFVNKCDKGVRIRYDDPGFILTDREIIRESESLKKIPVWTYEDAIEFDKGLAEADLVIISMWSAMGGNYYKTRNGVRLRLSDETHGNLREPDSAWFDSEFQKQRANRPQRLRLIAESFESILRKSPKATVFALGTYAARDRKPNGSRAAYNKLCRELSEEHENFEYVDVENIVPPEHSFGGLHLSHQGYVMVAAHILDRTVAAQKTADMNLATDAERTWQQQAPAGRDAGPQDIVI